MSMLDKEYIKSKIWKDEYDVNKLFGCKIDRDKLSVLLEAANFKSYFGRETERLKIRFL